MIYEFPITTTTSHTSTSPLKTRIKLTKGVLHQLDIVTDEATQWTLYIAIRHGLYQVFPSNPDQYFRLRGEPFSFKESYKLYAEPYEFVIHSYLSNADYSHHARVRMGFLREDELKGVKILWDEETEGIREGE